MRRTASLVISISLLLGIVIFVVPVGAERSPFVGSWWSIDVDDSYQRMAIGGGKNVRHVNYFDDGATVCGVDEYGVPLYPARARGTSVEAGNILTVTLDLWCFAKPPFFSGTYTMSLTYNPSNDTLVQYVPPPWDDYVIWFRIGGN